MGFIYEANCRSSLIFDPIKQNLKIEQFSISFTAHFLPIVVFIGTLEERHVAINTSKFLLDKHLETKDKDFYLLM